MAKRKQALGRGLNALLGDIKLEASRDQLQRLPVEFLQSSRFQPRKDIDPGRLRELADSISAQGMVQPIIVRQIENEKYEIIAGERRWRAARMAGLHEVPVVEKKVSDKAAMAMALIENIQREDLNPLDQAEALQRLAKEFEMTHQQIADSVGKSRATITNLLRLNELHRDVKSLLAGGEIEMGHARAILAVDKNRQSEVSRMVRSRGLSVRATEKLIQNLRENTGEKARAIDPDIERLQNDIAGRLGALVEIKHTKNGKGRLVIAYSSLEQLEGVLERFH